MSNLALLLFWPSTRAIQSANQLVTFSLASATPTSSTQPFWMLGKSLEDTYLAA